MGSGRADAGGEEQRQLLQPEQISAITAKGSLRFTVVEGQVNGERFIEFLKRLIHNAGRPIFLVLDAYPSIGPDRDPVRGVH